MMENIVLCLLTTVAYCYARPTVDTKLVETVTESPTESPVSSTPRMVFNPFAGLPDMDVHAPVIPSQQESGMTKYAFTYLMKFGYLPRSLLEKEGALRSVRYDAKSALKTFQQYSHLPMTGELDTRTVAMMARRRCGMPDIEYGETISHYGPGLRRRHKRYSLVSKRWNKYDLTFRIMNYSPDMTLDRIRSDVNKAFQLWTENSALRFTEKYHGEADIEIHFAKKYHADGYPFDGQGLRVAHAFYPGPGRGGDIHLDDDETWTWQVGTKDINLFSVVAHQFGHALGLGHSSTESSLMYPFFKEYHDNFTLPKDDLDGIQRLYGKEHPYPDWKPTEPAPTEFWRPPPKTTRLPVSTPDTCRTSYDCIAMINEEMFIFKDKYSWRVNRWGVIQDTPVETATFFYGMDDYVDAAYQSPKYGHIVFFRGKKYWIFIGNYLQNDFPSVGRPITELGIPYDIERVDAAFVWGFNKRVYLVSGHMYWRFNEEGRRVDESYPRDISMWQGVPHPVDAAFVDWDGVTHFFKGNKYYTFEDLYMRVKEGFPQSSAQAWLGCPEEKKSAHSSANSSQFSVIFIVLFCLVKCSIS